MKIGTRNARKIRLALFYLIFKASLLIPMVDAEAASTTLPRPEKGEPEPFDTMDRVAPRPERLGLYFRAGGLLVIPTGRSSEVEMANVSEQSRFSGINNGPIAGSYTRMGRALMLAGTIGYSPPILDRQLSIETVLALPFTQKLYAGGSLADTSLGPTVLDSVPTGVPAIGEDLGEVKMLPPVITAVYRFFPNSAVRPYLGLGACLLIVLDAKITNPVLTEVTTPKLDIPSTLGWVAQAGLEIRLSDAFFLTGDFKYIGGLNVTATVKDIWVRTPGLPIYGKTKIGDSIARVSVNPVVAQLGLGMDL